MAPRISSHSCQNGHIKRHPCWSVVGVFATVANSRFVAYLGPRGTTSRRLSRTPRNHISSLISDLAEPHLADDVGTTLASNTRLLLKIRNDAAFSRLRHCTRILAHQTHASCRPVELQAHTSMGCAWTVPPDTYRYTIWIMRLLCSRSKINRGVHLRHISLNAIETLF